MKKKVIVEKELDQNEPHLEPLYNTIKNAKPMNIKDIAAKYVFSTGKLLNEFVQALSMPMAKNHFVSAETGGLFHNKTLFVPNNEEVLRIIEKIRAEFLENGTLSDETIILGALLQKSDLIKNYFSKFESEKLKERLNEIKKNQSGSLVNEMVNYIDTLVAVIASAGSGASI